MTDFRTTFNETELLLLQLEMGGVSTGVGYRFTIEGLDKADFINEGSGEIYSTVPVQKADEFGTVRKISFRVEHEGGRQVERNKNPILRIHRDGHITTSTEVDPDLLNEVIDHVNAIKEHSEYIVSLNHMIDEYIHDMYRVRSSDQKSRKITKTINSFENLVIKYIERGDTQGEHRIYQSLVANIGVRLYRDGIPEAEQYFTVEQPDRDDLFNDEVKDFFSDYVRHTHQPMDVDYDQLKHHLHYWLSQTWDTPIEMIEAAATTYDW